MKLYKDGQDVSGSDVKLTDLVTMTIQLDDEFIGMEIVNLSMLSEINTLSGEVFASFLKRVFSKMKEFAH